MVILQMVSHMQDVQKHLKYKRKWLFWVDFQHYLSHFLTGDKSYTKNENAILNSCNDEYLYRNSMFQLLRCVFDDSPWKWNIEEKAIFGLFVTLFPHKDEMGETPKN